MKYLDVFLLIGRTSCMVPAVAVAMTLHALTKCLFAVLFNRSNCNAYAAE